MQAYRITQWQQGAQLCDVPVPEPGPGQVMLKVAGNGICFSDVHAMYDWPACPPHLQIELPLTLGHEVAGWVEACGPGVSGFETGTPCLVTVPGCGHCRACAQGWNNYCVNPGKVVGLGSDGGLAEYVSVPVSAAVPLGASIEPWQAAPLTDAGTSAYHAVNRVLPLLTPGSTVIVIGIGGLGHMALGILKALTAARIIAVDRSETALSLAADLGADHCVLSNEDTAANVTEICAGRKVDAVLDFVGAGVTMELAAALISALGHIVVVGRGHGAFEFKDRALPYGATMSTTFGGSTYELMQVVALAARGAIKPHITRYDLSDVQTAFDKLRAEEIVGRAVVVPDGH